MMQWKCELCGDWISMASMRHAHVNLVQPTMAEMIAARDMPGTDAMAVHAHTTYDTWTPSHKTRKAPGNE